RERCVKRFKSVSFPLYPECRLSLPVYTGLCRYADCFRPDIVHLVTPLGIGLAGLKYARERGIPVVSSFHTNFDMYLKYYNLEYFHDSLWNYFKWFHRLSAINFCPSVDTLKTLESKGIENLKIWSRGIDTDRFNPICRDEILRQKLGAGERKIFLYVGRLAIEKDLDILMLSIDKINNIYPGKAQFVLTGDGPHAGSLKDAAPENVVFPGYLRGKELAAMYASCDAFVFPSSTETFGNVILEAMASGLPVITVDSGGVKDSMLHNYNG
ncbi:MAG: glycosyl transferase family 1, partial [Clostridiales bacterium GWC2_40_7]